MKRALRELTGADHKVYAAGRTDAGAHALGQVVNFRLDGGITAERLPAALNATLPRDVSAVSCEGVEDGFHSRYSAAWRRYRYRYLDRRARPALERDYCWHYPSRLDEAAMAAGAQLLVGKHDWSSFCAAAEPAEDRVREVREASVARRGRFVDLEVLGDGFLRGLVRGIAGTLGEVGAGRRQPSWMREVLESRDRSRAGRAAPARGLTLMEVVY